MIIISGKTIPLRKRIFTKLPFYFLHLLLTLSAGALLISAGCGGSSTEMKRTLVLDKDDAPPQAVHKPEAKPAPVSPAMQGISKTFEKASLVAQPGYQALAEQLDNQEKKKGVKLFRNTDNAYQLFSSNSPTKFTISDKSGTCLFEVEIPVADPQNGIGKKEEMLITSGPCGLKIPDVDKRVEALVKTMANDFYASLMEVLNSQEVSENCTGADFLKKTLLKNYPFDLKVEGNDLEGYIAGIGYEIVNSLDIAFGDVVFFSPGKDNKVVGLYAGYGLVVYNKGCQAVVHRLAGNYRYRFYRILTGYAWTNYQLPGANVLQEMIENPR
ncbi:MAG: hypothetical protein KKE17_15490 [Proteobacteria bacterium]|nr:hypothetical protein [Pseudomonadota bacterium]MBU1711401.1 hypothetical protein [Pseudomonadota bacterium]